MAKSHRQERAAKNRIKGIHKKSREARGRELDGVIYVRTELPESDLVDWHDLVMHAISEAIVTLESEGCDTEALTVVTLGRTHPKAPGQMVVEVKSKLAPGTASIFRDPAEGIVMDFSQDAEPGDAEAG